MRLFRGQARIISVVVISAAALSFAAFIGRRALTVKPELPDEIKESDLTFQGRRLRGFVLGGEGLLADWYWMQSLQYIGGKLVAYEGDINLDDLRPLKPRLLYQYLENATDLDPHFYAAYAYGAVVLPAIDNMQAIALIKKGIANNPDKWRFYQYLGYIYWRLGDYRAASEAYSRGAEIPDAPAFMLEMSAAMKSRGGERETARAIYRQLYENAEDAKARENALLRLYEIDANEQLEAVNAALTERFRKSGKCTSGRSALIELLRTINLPPGNEIKINASGMPVDPTGVAFQFDQLLCRMAIAPESKIPKPLE